MDTHAHTYRQGAGRMRLKMLLTILIVLTIFEGCMAFVLPHSFTTFVAQGSNRVFNLCPYGSSDRYSRYRYTAASRDAAVHCAGLRAMQRGVRMAESSAYELAPKCTRKFQFVPYGDNSTQKIIQHHTSYKNDNKVQTNHESIV